MMQSLSIYLQLLYAVCLGGLALYGIHAFWLSLQYTRRGPVSLPPTTDLPTVTVQLPIYNERHVAERLIAACAQLDYPSDKLHIQVLDDSDDITSALIQRAVRHWQQRGVDIEVVRRDVRDGFKAGALAYALPTAKGEFIALFDADFVPPTSFLHHILPHFFTPGNGSMGFVQARWGHLNLDYSLLTRCQALALDGHFVVEQTGRMAAGYPFGFNGSAGVWRRACIEDPAVGGWQTDTLCEDLDLSYRAQLAGWHGLYLGDLEVPAEIPVQLLAFKRQQFRWAKGSVQTLRKLARRVISHPWPRANRLAALGHLGNYLIHPLLLLLLLVSLPMVALGIDPAAPLAYLSLFSFGPPLLYAIAQRRLYPATWLRRWALLPLLMLFGTGLALNNTIAVVQGLTGKGGDFLRTPKFQVHGADDQWQHSSYRLPLPPVVLAELTLACYALATVIAAATQGQWGTLLFLLLYAAGFGTIAGVGLWQAWQSRSRHRQAHRRAAVRPARPEQAALDVDGKRLPL